MFVNGIDGGCGCGCVATDGTGSHAEEVVAEVVLIVLLEEVEVALGAEEKLCCLQRISAPFEHCVIREWSVRASGSNFCVELHGNGTAWNTLRSGTCTDTLRESLACRTQFHETPRDMRFSNRTEIHCTPTFSCFFLYLV